MTRPFRVSIIPSSSLQPIMPCLICRLLQNSFTRVSGWTLNGIWSFVRPCLQASRFPLKRAKDSPSLQAKGFGRVTLLPGTELRPVSFNKRQQNEEAFFQKHSWRAHVSPMFPSFPYGKHCFQCQFLFSRSKSCLRYAAGKFNENPSKNLRARASDHSCNFSEQFEQKPNLANNFQLNGTTRHPLSSLC